MVRVDQGLGINYHPGKANVVTDTLSRRSHMSQSVVESIPFELCEEFARSILGSLRIPKPWRWKWDQAYFKRFGEANWKMRRSKR
jgi:hypothetical protein